MNYSLNRLYQAAGLTRQAVHDYLARAERQQAELAACLIEVDIIREEHPGCGLRSLYEVLNPDWIGRDRFCELLAAYGYQLHRQPARKNLTRSGQVYYPNLIEAMYINQPDRVWQSDTTYFKVGRRYYYLTFVLDVYTRMIVGYYVSYHLRSEANIRALMMALEARKNIDYSRLFHHSDRGSQYRDGEYTGILNTKEIQISMGAMAQDNAYVERVHNTIKNEYLTYWSITSYDALQEAVDRAVAHYNTKRQHSSLEKLSPKQFEHLLLTNQLGDNPKQILYSTQTRKLPNSLINQVQPVDFPFCIL